MKKHKKIISLMLVGSIFASTIGNMSVFADNNVDDSAPAAVANQTQNNDIAEKNVETKNVKKENDFSQNENTQEKVIEELIKENVQLKQYLSISYGNIAVLNEKIDGLTQILNELNGTGVSYTQTLIKTLPAVAFYASRGIVADKLSSWASFIWQKAKSLGFKKLGACGLMLTATCFLGKYIYNKIRENKSFVAKNNDNQVKNETQNVIASNQQ